MPMCELAVTSRSESVAIVLDTTSSRDPLYWFPPSGGDEHSLVDGCDRVVFIVE